MLVVISQASSHDCQPYTYILALLPVAALLCLGLCELSGVFKISQHMLSLWISHPAISGICQGVGCFWGMYWGMMLVAKSFSQIWLMIACGKV